MYLIECLPFSKGLNKESLSYFGPKYIEPGSLIKISIRNKSTPAMVLGVRSAAEAKSEIKSADFQLKKIGSQTSGVAKPFLQKEFLEAVQETAEYFTATSGSVLTHLIPAFILENPGLLNLKNKLESGNSDNVEKKTKNDVATLQAPDEERFIHYRSLIREEFAKKKSIFLCLPQNEDVRRAKENLLRGIESFVYAFHNEMGKKELRKEWKEALSNPHPILLISTAKWLFTPRGDFGAVIIDKENESGWKTLSRPFIDLRFFAETLARKKNIRAIYGDSFLRTETLYRYKEGEISEFENVKWRLPPEAKTETVDLKKNPKKSQFLIKEETEFKSISPELARLIKETAEKNSHMFIFAARKGLSSVTVCRDCGEQVKCGNCSSPMILYKGRNGNIFKCHQCGETRDAAETCKNCGSWKLAAFGAGIDRVADEIRKDFPGLRLFEINKDMTDTANKAFDVALDFYNTKGSVLLGTEMAFSCLNKKISKTAIASFDSLFSIPDFRIKEKIFRLILQVRSLAKDEFLIQTRNPDDLAVELAASGNLLEFYKKEIEDRRSLGYPPFGIFIKITVRGTRNFVTREVENLKKELEPLEEKMSNKIAYFPSIHEKRGEQAAANAVIKIPRRGWVDQNLLFLLKSLPPHFEIKIDPDNLL